MNAWWVGLIALIGVNSVDKISLDKAILRVDKDGSNIPGLVQAGNALIRVVWRPIKNAANQNYKFPNFKIRQREVTKSGANCTRHFVQGHRPIGFWREGKPCCQRELSQVWASALAPNGSHIRLAALQLMRINYHSASSRVSYVLIDKQDFSRFHVFPILNITQNNPRSLRILRYISLPFRLLIGAEGEACPQYGGYSCNEGKYERAAPKRLFAFAMLALIGVPAVIYRLNKEREFSIIYFFVTAAISLLTFVGIIGFIVTALAPEIPY